MTAWRMALRELSSKKLIPANTKAFLLILDAENATVRWSPLEKRDLPKAEETRFMLEKTTGKDVVIVYVDSISNLRKAYPNYFGDSEIFMGLMYDREWPRWSEIEAPPLHGDGVTDEMWAADVRKSFDGEVVVGRDLMEI